MEFNESFSNKSLHRLLALIAAVYMLNGENRFKVVAYQKAAEAVEQLPRELYSIWKEGKLREVPGFKASIGESVEELFRQGFSKHFEKILAGVPKSLPVMMDVPGIGPKKAIKLINEFKLYDDATVLSDVVKLAEAGNIAVLDGFGEKSQTDIKEAIELHMRVSTNKMRYPYPIAAEIAKQVEQHMRKIPGVEKFETMGSLRRRLATIGDVDITITAPDADAKAIIDHFVAIPGKLSVEAAGDDKAAIIFPPNIRVDLRITDQARYGSMLQYFTGSKQHNIKLREFALKKGMSLNEYGIKDTATGDVTPFDTEEKFYAHLGLDWVPPEIREGTDEVELARKHTLPQLVRVEDIRGDFHIHANYDLKTSHDLGANTYTEIVDKAVSLGYSYVGFADHNPRQSGHNESEIVEIMKRRREHIDTELRGSKIPYYVGLEVDILPSGEVALPEKAVEYVDYLIVSVHSSFTQTMEEQTTRILKALSFPKVRVFGHPTGRLINKRDGIQLDWRKVFKFAAEKNIAIEINASPQRLDLPDSLVKEGKEYGSIYMVNTDSHATVHMDMMEYGVSVARRGWLEPKDVVNMWDPGAFDRWIRR
jgi:DNA polymerase (family 10)